MTSSALYTQSYGDNSLQPLVLIHGWGMNADIWAEWAQALSEHFYVITVDLPGLGRSPMLHAGCSLRDVSATVMSALSSEKKTIIWLGWSLGGLVAAQVAQDFPNKVKGLITMATNPCFVAQSDWPLGMDEPTFSQFETALQQNSDKTLQRFAALMVKGDKQSREQLRALKTLLSDSQSKPQVAGLSSALSLLKCDARVLFSQIKLPHEYWFAAQDALVDSALADSAELSASSWLIDDAGHLPFMSQQEKCTKQLIAFASSLEATHG